VLRCQQGCGAGAPVLGILPGAGAQMKNSSVQNVGLELGL